MYESKTQLTDVCAASLHQCSLLVVRVAEVAEGAEAALQCASSSSFCQTCRTRDGSVYIRDSIIMTLWFREYLKTWRDWSTGINAYKYKEITWFGPLSSRGPPNAGAVRVQAFLQWAGARSQFRNDVFLFQGRHHGVAAVFEVCELSSQAEWAQLKKQFTQKFTHLFSMPMEAQENFKPCFPH